MRAIVLALVVACGAGCRATAAEQPALHEPSSPPSATGEGEPERGSEPSASSDDGPAPEIAGEETVEDDPEVEGELAAEAGETRPHPLDGWSSADIDRAVKSDLGKLGSISLGAPNAGLLLNGVQALETPYFKPVSPSGAFGTQETIDFLSAALAKVHREFPGTPPLALGHISAEHGGHLKPHVSHQAGRDVDIGFFYRSGSEWYRRGTADNLDLERNWAFVRALVTETDVDMILVDQSIQELLQKHARSIGEDAAWVDGLFHGARGQRAIVRHAPGHGTHFHVRFFNPLAQETARRAYKHLVAHGLVPPVQDYVRYRAKKGDTLGKLAKRFGTSVISIKQANALKKNLIREKQVYLIPSRDKRPRPPPPRLTFPTRRLPPAASARRSEPLDPTSAAAAAKSAPAASSSTAKP